MAFEPGTSGNPAGALPASETNARSYVNSYYLTLPTSSQKWWR